MAVKSLGDEPPVTPDQRRNLKNNLAGCLVLPILAYAIIRLLIHLAG